MWIKNTKGKPDAMLTIAIVAFAVVVLNVFLATFGTITLAGTTFTFIAMDAGVMAAFLAPTLTAYVTRRWTSAAYPVPGTPPVVVKPEKTGTTTFTDNGVTIEIPDDFDPTGDFE